MSAGVRARELAFVNGDREFAARFVVVERVVVQERSANYFVIERSELIFCHVGGTGILGIKFESPDVVSYVSECCRLDF